MSKRKRARISTIFTLIGLLGLVIVAWLNRHQLSGFWHLLHTLSWPVVCLVVIVQILSYFANARYYRSILVVFKYHIPVYRLFEGALATNFVNYVLPSAGLAGAGYLSQVLSPEVPRGVSVLTQLFRYGLSALAVIVMMPVGYALVLLMQHSSHPILLAGLWSTIGIVALAAVLIWLIAHEAIFRRLIHTLERLGRRVSPSFRPHRVERFLNDFYKSFRIVTARKRALLIPFYWSMFYIVIEILTFYLAFVAFGIRENPGTAILAYLFANIASIFGGVFISTGVFELGMAGTLVALGSPLTQALAVTIVYRVLNLAIGLPPGFIFYRRYLPR